MVCSLEDDMKPVCFVRRDTISPFDFGKTTSFLSTSNMVYTEQRKKDTTYQWNWEGTPGRYPLKWVPKNALKMVFKMRIFMGFNSLQNRGSSGTIGVQFGKISKYINPEEKSWSINNLVSPPTLALRCSPIVFSPKVSGDGNARLVFFAFIALFLTGIVYLSVPNSVYKLNTPQLPETLI